MLNALILLLLATDVVSDLGLVAAYRRDKVPPRPKVLAHEVPPALGVCARDVDRALALEVPDHLRDRVLRRDRDQHMHMIQHQMPLFDPALLVLSERPKHLPQVAAKLLVQRPAPALRDEHPLCQCR